MYKPHLALNNLQWLICHKTEPKEDSNTLAIQDQGTLSALLFTNNWKKGTYGSVSSTKGIARSKTETTWFWIFYGNNRYWQPTSGVGDKMCVIWPEVDTRWFILTLSYEIIIDMLHIALFIGDVFFLHLCLIHNHFLLW